jgi:hypothetical protein
MNYSSADAFSCPPPPSSSLTSSALAPGGGSGDGSALAGKTEPKIQRVGPRRSVQVPGVPITPPSQASVDTAFLRSISAGTVDGGAAGRSHALGRLPGTEGTAKGAAATASLAAGGGGDGAKVYKRSAAGRSKRAP